MARRYRSAASGERSRGAQARAAQARPLVRFPGCTNRLFLEGHHIQHWADGGETSLSKYALLVCSVHHRHVHEYGYTIELGPDQRPRFRDPTAGWSPRCRTSRDAADWAGRRSAAANEALHDRRRHHRRASGTVRRSTTGGSWGTSAAADGLALLRERLMTHEHNVRGNHPGLNCALKADKPGGCVLRGDPVRQSSRPATCAESPPTVSGIAVLVVPCVAEVLATPSRARFRRRQPGRAIPHAGGPGPSARGDMVPWEPTCGSRILHARRHGLTRQRSR